MDKILAIAKRVRRRLEKVSEIPDCSGMCAIGSSALALTLQRFKFNCRLVVGKFRKSDHCWVETRTHIIDITATQFGNYDKVFVLHKSDLHALVLYQENKRLKPDPNPEHRFWRRWTRKQRPNKEMLEFLIHSKNKR